MPRMSSSLLSNWKELWITNNPKNLAHKARASRYLGVVRSTIEVCTKACVSFGYSKICWWCLNWKMENEKVVYNSDSASDLSYILSIPGVRAIAIIEYAWTPSGMTSIFIGTSACGRSCVINNHQCLALNCTSNMCINFRWSRLVLSLIVAFCQ